MERGQNLHMEKKPQSKESAVEKKIQLRQTEKQRVHNKKSTYKTVAPRRKIGCLTWFIILAIIFFAILPILEQVGEKLWDELDVYKRQAYNLLQYGPHPAITKEVQGQAKALLKEKMQQK